MKCLIRISGEVLRAESKSAREAGIGIDSQVSLRLLKTVIAEPGKIDDIARRITSKRYICVGVHHRLRDAEVTRPATVASPTVPHPHQVRQFVRNQDSRTRTPRGIKWMLRSI